MKNSTLSFSHILCVFSCPLFLPFSLSCEFQLICDLEHTNCLQVVADFVRDWLRVTCYFVEVSVRHSGSEIFIANVVPVYGLK